MDVSDACRQKVYAQISDGLALLGIGALAHTYNSIFFSADGTHLCLDGNALAMCGRNQLGGLGNVLLNGIMGAVEHDGREACLDTLVAVLIGAMIQMDGYGYIDVQILQKAVHHAHYRVIAAHVLAGAFGHTQNHGRLALLCSQQDSLGPLQIIDIELSYRVMTCLCLFQHLCC